MKKRSKIKFEFLIFLTLVITCNNSIFSQSITEIPEIDEETETRQEESEELNEYDESALRRFEIITLSSLPFTAVHSFFMVRGIEMIHQNKFSPKLSDQNFRVIGICTACFSLFIGIRDWYITRGKDRSEPLIPQESLPKRRPIEPNVSLPNNTTIRLVGIQF
ncbi:TPA: hypothetical protein EYN98_29830 [Candidatus Poribacteria bacterium]|nr:hypothetical protein [Candidatus Poribacteria bacterium]HIA70172.1 hypothetical protein [Candidatus Poribacteria bacterium]HIB89507.1 hypothetical protein [Candidatus Poribacteria bacterium]HIC01737.1 hypothetical protein [Candidatus Poribacteria bacterium]HIC16783.1 hypothetical protein [Candidatus Poribacteria bacterium]